MLQALGTTRSLFLQKKKKISHACVPLSLKHKQSFFFEKISMAKMYQL